MIAILITCSIALTFAIPVMQWLVNEFISDAEYRGIISSIPIILCISLWRNKSKAFSFQPTSHRWRALYHLMLVAVFGLLLFNAQNQPVSKITGEARSPFEVLNVIVLVPLAEELIFRGIIWSVIEKIAKGEFGRVAVLTGTSLLFGAEHLGYWAQSNWPLTLDAYFHAISMVFAGVFFGFFRFKSDSLAVPTALHMLANGAILLTQ